MGLQTPILFCLFNRPDLTRRVFASIAAQRPSHLLVSCDGPRPNHLNDRTLIEQSRAVIDAIDWPCEVQTLYADVNVGCRKQMARAISWAFTHHEQVIILEDDCLPDPTFYNYCQLLLDRYAQTDQVMMISGDNFQDPQRRSAQASYYFSGYSHIWGWATWRRAWQHFELEMSSWSLDAHASTLARYCCNDDERHYWGGVFGRQQAGEIDTWDYSWQWTCWHQQGLVILPQNNLVTNIGFRGDGTHTLDSGHWLANSPVRPIDALVHPETISRDWLADSNTWHQVFAPPATLSFPGRQRSFLQKLFGRRAA